MLVIVNNAAVYTEVQMSLQHSDSTSFAYILRNRMLDLTAALLLILFFSFWPCLWHVEVPGAGTEPMPQQ